MNSQTTEYPQSSAWTRSEAPTTFTEAVAKLDKKDYALLSALMEIHAADDNPPELFIKDVVFPEELGHLTDRFVNLDELN